MPAQHPKVGQLRAHVRHSRSSCWYQPAPADMTDLLNWAIRVCEAADNLVNVKGRHHAELAYRRLEEAVNGQD